MSLPSVPSTSSSISSSSIASPTPVTRQPSLPSSSPSPSSSSGQLRWALNDGKPLDNEALAQADLSVDIYHLNIGTGDAAIYYLVQHPTLDQLKANPNLKPFIHRAVLIDGGKQRDGSINIRTFLHTRVREFYNFDDQQGGRTGLTFPPFDSILITHWDQDHYAGILTLISDDLILDQSRDPVSARAPLTAYLSPYCKYEDPPPPPTTTGGGGTPSTTTPAPADRLNRAETYIYAPYWGEKVFGFSSRGNPYVLTWPEAICSDKGMVWYNDDGLTQVHTGTDGKPVVLEGYLDWNSKFEPRGRARTYEEWAKKLCKIRAGNDCILGTNLFTNLRPEFAAVLKCTNPKELAEAHHERMLNGATSTFSMPTLCIVAANNQCCGENQDGITDKFAAAIKQLQADYAPKFNKTVDSTLYDSVFNPERLEEAEDEIKSYFKHFVGTDTFHFPSDSTSTVSSPPVTTNISSPTNSTLSPLPATSSGLFPANTSMSNSGPPSAAPFELKSKSVVTPSSPFPHLINSRNPLFNINTRKIVDTGFDASKDSKRANAVSVISLLVWSDGQISQLTAGDADWGNEMKIVAWIRVGRNPFQSVRSIKLSHHGATDSTPTEMIQHLRPRNIVVSAATTQYGHPKYDVLLWIHLWWRVTKGLRYVPPPVMPKDPSVDLSKKENIVKPKTRGILTSTAFPYYLNQKTDPSTGLPDFEEIIDGSSISTVYFDSWSIPVLKVAPEVRKYLDSMYYMILLLGSKTVDYREPLKGVTDTLVRLRKIFNAVLEAWPFISLVKPQQHQGFVGDFNADTGYNIIGADEQIQYVKVHCRPNDRPRRYAKDSFLDGFSMEVTHNMTALQAGGVGYTGGDIFKRYKDIGVDCSVTSTPSRKPPGVTRPRKKRKTVRSRSNSVPDNPPNTGTPVTPVMGTIVVPPPPGSLGTYCIPNFLPIYPNTNTYIPPPPPALLNIRASGTQMGYYNLSSPFPAFIPSNPVTPTPAPPPQTWNAFPNTRAIGTSLGGISMGGSSSAVGPISNGGLSFNTNSTAIPSMYGNSLVVTSYHNPYPYYSNPIPPFAIGTFPPAVFTNPNYGFSTLTSNAPGPFATGGPFSNPGNNNLGLRNNPLIDPFGKRKMVASSSSAQSTILANTHTSEKAPPINIRRDVASAPSGPIDLIPASFQNIWSASGRSNPMQIVPEENYGMFMRAFQYPFFVAESTGKLVSEDVFRTWMLRALDEDETSVNAMVNLMLIPVPSSTTSTYITGVTVNAGSITDYPQLAFSTSSLSGNFASKMDPTGIPANGIFPYHTFLALGLDKIGSSTDGWNVGQILQYTGLIGASTGAVIHALAHDLGEPKEFTLNKGMIWFMPLENNMTVQRMEWILSEPLQKKVKEFFDDWMPKSLNMDNISIVSRKTSLCAPTRDGYDIHRDLEVALSFDLHFGTGNKAKTMTVDLDFDLAMGGTSIILTLKFDGIGDHSHGATLADMFDWLETLLDNVKLGGILESFPKLDIAGVKRVEMRCSKGSIDRVSVDVEVVPGWKDAAQNGNEVIFLFTYTWTKGRTWPHSLKGRVWFGTDEHDWMAPQIMPNFEETRTIRPSQPALTEINLTSILTGHPPLPSDFVDLAITDLEVDVDGNTISFTGTLAATADPKRNHLGISLAEVTLYAGYTWAINEDGTKSGPNQSSYNIKLSTEIDLAAPGSEDSANEDYYDPASIKASIELVSRGTEKFFQLYGTIDKLNLGLLGQLFPEEDAGIVTDLLGHLTIKRFSIEYDYDSKTGDASQFYVYADLIISVVELDLAFRRDRSGWEFEAQIHAAAGVKATVGEILTALLGNSGKGIVESVPTFLTGIDLGKGQAGIRLAIDSVPEQKPANENDPPISSSIIVSFSLFLPGPGGVDFECTLLQVTEKLPSTGDTANRPTTNTNAANAASTGSPTSQSAQSRTKRLIKVTMADLPWHLIPKPPIIDRIEPAFDQLGFYWIQDPIDNLGLKLADITRMNKAAPYPILYKEVGKQVPGKNMDQAIVLSSGWHFVVLDSGGHGQPKALLDYAFNKPKPTRDDGVEVEPTPGQTDPEPQTQPKPKPKPKLADAGVPDTKEDGQGTSKGAVEKTVSTFKISNVGIRYENSELIIFLDIIAHLGPIEFALNGLGFGMKLNELKFDQIGRHIPSFHLQGMGIEYNQPPVLIAGMFKEVQNEDMKMYIGGVALSVLPYQFIAIGAYGEVRKPAFQHANETFDMASSNGHTFKTVFIFAKLNGPLIELEIATIGGITLGFGYNSTVQHPRIEDVPTFPFIANSGTPGSGDPLAVMQSLSDPIHGIVTPEDGSYWIAAGLEGKALEILDLSAVVILEFNPYVSLSIYARAQASMPPETPRIACFTYVELGIMAYVDFHQGQLRIEAQLSPNSFVMNPFCHLSGGFALCYWFGNSPYAGDFMFSIGGFHPAYKVPSHYPVPPRLAITWALSDMLMIRGEAYFAVTTKACMGGGMLTATFNMGLLSAYLTAHADFLMEFHPFFFMADIGITIGVEFDLELLFITIHISVHLGAQLHLQGPPFGGYAYVDFWVFGFTIPFGDHADPNPPLTVDGFYGLLTNIPDPEAKPGGSATVDKLHVLSVETGRFTEKQKDGDSKQDAIWEVRGGGFSFRVQTRIPLQSIEEPVFNDEATANITDSALPAFYARPMHLTEQLISTMTVSVQKEEDNGLFEDIDFRISAPILKDVPKSLWGLYNEQDSPGSGSNNIDSLLNATDGTVRLMMGVTFIAPAPHISEDLIKPFNAIDAAAENVFADGVFEPELPDHVDFASEAWGSAAPVVGGAQNEPWLQAVDGWMNPEAQLEAGEAHTPEESRTMDEAKKDQAIVQATIEAWSLVFAWDVDGRGAGNELKNEVTTKDGAEPLVWKNFDQLYMVPPMIGIAT